MRDLLAKIEELRKSLAAMKPKDYGSSLVPALKPPTIKSISISAPAASKQPKMPGVSPASNKDPKKMAEQLKNPRPKKPKIEMLKFEKNGQWSLDKAYATDWEETPEEMSIPEKAYKDPKAPLQPLPKAQRQLIAGTIPKKQQAAFAEHLITGEDPSLKGPTSEGLVHYEKIPQHLIWDEEEIPASVHEGYKTGELVRDYRRDATTGKLYHKVLTGPYRGRYFSISAATLPNQTELKNIIKKPHPFDKSDDMTHIQSYLPAHIAKMGESSEPGTSEHEQYVDAAHDWHHKVHQAIMHDNPHLKHSFGEGLHPRLKGYHGRLKSTKALDKLCKEHGAHYSVGEEESN